MQRMMDKHLIYVTCLLLLLPGNKGYEPVLTLLASLTIMEISMLFSHKWVRYGILAFFCVCCLIFQPLTFFLPIFLYDLAMEGEWWGYVSLALFFTIGNGEPVSQQLAGINWAPFVLGLSVVGLEVGAIFMYKAGWEVSVGNIVQAIFVAIALLIVGVLIYKEALTATKVAGIAACLVGIFLLNK